MEPKHILAIDDDPDIRDLLRLSFARREGWTLSLAPSGAEGLRLAELRLPDAILLDARMPGMDGPATLQALRAQTATRAIPVVMLSASPDLDARFHWSIQPDGAIAKPFNPLSLPERLAAILNWCR